jgi:predicted phage terminase large subunit-like protein
MVAYTRLMPDAAVVIIATRWHEEDLVGWLLSEFKTEGWESLSFPALAEAHDALGRAEGEPLWPERYGREALDSIRRQLGSAAFASLYQQRPTPLEGRIFRREWWQHYSSPPEFWRTVMSVDSAFKTGETNDFSAFTIWGETELEDFYLLHASRERLEFPDLKRKVAELAYRWNPDAVLIEDNASGQSLIQELCRDTDLPVIGIRASRDKVSRAIATTPLVEAGKVFLPELADWLLDYREELDAFPGSVHDDYVDSTTQALRYMRDVGLPGVF